ncbi:MAG: putative ABC transporter permease [Bacilli bacterium]|nr:putative ABC transporter permease [Bacilli bacterium]
MEVCVCSIEERKFINRGFLIGPYCPIYGFGGLILLSLSYFKEELILVFILSSLLCSSLEYLTSYLMEVLFKVRWWDYSNDPFNLNGRICLRNSLAFGILGMILVSFINPYIFNFLESLSKNTLIISSIILFIVTILDIIISFNIMNNIKGTIVKLNNDSLKDATNDIKSLIKNTLLEKSFLYRRFVKAYDKFECYCDELVGRIEKIKKEQSIKLKKLKNNREHSLIMFIVSGFLLGIIIMIINKRIESSFIIGLGIGIIISSLYDKVRKKYED